MVSAVHRTLHNPVSSGPPVAGYLAWYDATTLSLSSGASVTSWPDLSANGYNLATFGTDASPTYQPSGTNSINGHPAVFWADTTTLRRLHNSSHSLNQPFTIAMVAKTLSVTTDQFTVGDNDPSNFTYTYLGVSSSSTCWQIQASQVVTDSSIDTSAHAVFGVFNTSSSAISHDGGGQSTGTLAAQFYGTVGWSVGGAPTSSSNLPFEGAVGELIIYPSALTGTQIASLHTYFKNKWGTP